MTWCNQLEERGIFFPTSYVVFDTETSGLDDNEDFILQFGCLSVENGIEKDSMSICLDWTNTSLVTYSKLAARIASTKQRMVKNGKTYRFNPARLKNEGEDPKAVLTAFLNFFETHQRNGLFFLTHNGFSFDKRMIEGHFRRFLNSSFCFDPTKIIDTGLMEKAKQLSLLPRDDESLPVFYRRVYNVHAKGVRWRLSEHCLPKYGLDKKHGLDISCAHDAAFDCRATHFLYQEYLDQLRRI